MNWIGLDWTVLNGIESSTWFLLFFVGLLSVRPSVRVFLSTKAWKERSVGFGVFLNYFYFVFCFFFFPSPLRALYSLPPHSFA